MFGLNFYLLTDLDSLFTDIVHMLDQAETDMDSVTHNPVIVCSPAGVLRKMVLW